jgi:hypothetical protein
LFVFIDQPIVQSFIGFDLATAYRHAKNPISNPENTKIGPGIQRIVLYLLSFARYLGIYRIHHQYVLAHGLENHIDRDISIVSVCHFHLGILWDEMGVHGVLLLFGCTHWWESRGAQHQKHDHGGTSV